MPLTTDHCSLMFRAFFGILLITVIVMIPIAIIAVILYGNDRKS